MCSHVGANDDNDGDDGDDGGEHCILDQKPENFRSPDYNYEVCTNHCQIPKNLQTIEELLSARE